MSVHSEAHPPPGEAAKPRPRWGLVIRALIYLPLLAFFGWRAYERFANERQIADDNFRASVDQWLKHPPRTIIMPNGEAMPVLELTEQEAKDMGLLPEPAPQEGVK